MSNPIAPFLSALHGTLNYSSADSSFSPFFSNVGLGFNDQPGINALYLHYNRLTTTFGLPLLRAPGQLLDSEQTALGVRQLLEQGSISVAFFDQDAWILQCADVPALSFRWTDLRIGDQYTGVYFPFEMHDTSRWMNASAADWSDPVPAETGLTRRFAAYLPAADARDPDRIFPLLLGLRVIRGEVGGDGVETPLWITPDANGTIVIAFAVSILEVGWEAARGKLAQAPSDISGARERTQAWLMETLGGLSLFAPAPAEAQVLAAAAHTLVHNMYRAPGLLAGRVAVCPNRGGYATHFLWDSCFQTLAIGTMRRGLAEDSLLLLVENMRFDGKLPQFICSTWTRPHESQPPLVGWAGLKLVKRNKNLDLAKRLLRALLRNTNWWLTHRMSACGLIATYSGFETGWDNTPRFDRGPIIACDMNSYLLGQLRCCAELAALLGERTLAQQLTEQADAYARRMVEVLYDDHEGRFTEVLVQTGERLRLKTPAIFLPLWAGVPLTEPDVRRIIEGCLLHPALFFGRFPFPCVAYDEDCYDPGDWWRGPVWLPIAYLMLETLEQYGYHNERREAARRLYQMVLDDGQISELFNSRTGEGLGCKQLGWTAAIVLKLHEEMQGPESRHEHTL